MIKRKKQLSGQFIKNDCKSKVGFSKCRTYRYFLKREWSEGAGNILFIMLNPSTADKNYNDPTVDKCMKWSIKWRYSSFTICNLFAYRETDRNKMLKLGREEFNIVGEPVKKQFHFYRLINNKNDFWINQLAQTSEKIICAWGNEGSFLDRDVQVLKMLKDCNLYAMKINKNASPGHPLYLKNDTEPVPYIYKK